MARRARTALAAMLFVAMLLGSLPASAGPGSVEADAHFKSGVLLYKEANYAAALAEFKRAYEIDPKYQVLYNIAESSYQLQDYAGALRNYQKYLEQGGAGISPSR